MNYSANVASAGLFNLGVRIASSGAGGTFHLESAGHAITGSIKVPDTRGWGNWQTLTVNTVPLPAGPQVIKIVFDSAGSTPYVGNLNSITFTAVAPSTPFSTNTISDTVPTTLELENFDNGGEGIAYHDTDSANTGGSPARPNTGVDLGAANDPTGGVALGYVRAGEWLRYTVNVTTAGTYTFDYRVASAGLGGKFHLEVDSVPITGALSVPDTKGWANWSTLTQNNVALSSGIHVLRVFFDTAPASGYVGNLNWMRLTKT